MQQAGRDGSDCLSCTTTEQQIVAPEYHEPFFFSFFFFTVAHDIAGTQLMFPLILHRAVTLHTISKQITCKVTATSLTAMN